ncbi:MAG: Ig-like domain-containing protein, partial [Methanomicrobiaceae archaeon]|nr:Ig-like domain-containing protein [Methanomicrobiaceae archaeon]
VVGLDTLVGTLVDSGGIVRTSNIVTVLWTTTPPPPGPESIRLIPGPSPILVGTSYSTIAHVNDTAGNPVANRYVRLDITGISPSLNKTGTTDSTGNVTFTYTRTITGNDTLIATMTDSGGVVRTSNTVAVTWTTTPPPPGPESIRLIPGPASNLIGASYSAIAHVNDTAGNPVANRYVRLDITGISPSLNKTGTTDSAGNVTFTYTRSVAGTDSLVGTMTDSGGIVRTSNTVAVTWTTTPPPPGAESIRLIPGPASNLVNTQYSTIAHVNDTAGNPVAGRLVRLDITGISTLNQTGTTDPTGNVTFTYTRTIAGTDTLVANMTDSGGVVRTSNTVSVVWTTTPPTETIVLIPGPASILAGTPYTAIARVINTTTGNPVSGRSVQLSITNLGMGSPLPPLPPMTNTTDSSGNATFTYTRNAADIVYAAFDQLDATMTDSSGVVRTSNTVWVVWTTTPPPPPPGAESIELIPGPTVNLIGTNYTAIARVTNTTTGSPVSGRSVRLDIIPTFIGSLPPLPPMTNTTDSSGNATFTYTRSAVGYDALVANMTDSGGVNRISNSILVVWGVLPSESITLSPASATRAITTDHTVTAYVADSFGNTISNRPVNFTVESGPNAGLNGGFLTNSTGFATFTYTSTAVGTDTLVANMTDSGGVVRTSNTVTVTWTTTPPPGPDLIVLSPATASLTVGDLHAVTATVTTAGGSPIAGRQVNFTVITGPNAGLNFTGTTDLGGNATFPFSAAAPGTDTVEATMTDSVGALQTSNTVSVTWTTGPVPPPVTELITLSPVSATLQVGNVHTVTAFVRASNGTPIEEREVTFEVLSGPNAGLLFGGDTDSYGYTEFPFSANATGTDLVRATMIDSGGVNRTSNTVSVTWKTGPVPPVGETITLSPKSASPRVGGTIRMTALVLAAGTPVDERLVMFAITSGPNAGRKFKGMTDSNGYATFPHSSSTTGTDTIIATMTDSAGSQKTSNEAKIRWRDGPSRPDRITLSPKHSRAYVGGTMTLTAHVSIRSGSPGGRTVTFSITAGPNAGRTYTATTDSNGYATFPYSSSKTGTDTVIATMTDSTGTKRTSNKAYVHWRTHPSPPMHDRISLSPLSADYTVGELHEFTALVVTRFGTPIGGRTVVFSFRSGPNAGRTYTATTDAAGYATFPYTSSAPGTDTATASMTDSGGTKRTSNEATVTWHAGPTPPAPEQIRLSPLSGTAAVGDACHVTAYVFTSAGTPVAGRPVTFTVEGGPHVGVNGTVVTDALGYAPYSYSGAAAGTDTVVAAMVNASGQQQRSNTVTVTWTLVPPPPGAESVRLIPGPLSNLVGTPYSAIAHVNDTAGNPIAGRFVRLDITGIGPLNQTGTTDSAGNVTFTYTRGVVGTDTLNATMTDSGGAVRTSNIVTVLWTTTPPPPGPETISLIPGPATVQVTTPYTTNALVLDEYGNPVSNRPIDFTVIAGPHAGTVFGGVTGTNGLVPFTYTGWQTGTDFINATMIDSGGVLRVSNTVSVTWTDEPVVNNDTITLIPASAARTVGQQHTVTAFVRDGTGAAISFRHVSIRVMAGPNAGQSTTGLTGAAGTVLFTYTGNGGIGIDRIIGDMYTPGGILVTSNTATVAWSIPPTPVPEFPGVVVPFGALMLLCVACRAFRRR